MNIDDLKNLDDETRKEIESLLKFTREKDGDELFVNNQFEISRILQKKGDFEGVLSILRYIKEEDGYLKFIDAQFNVANILLERGDNEGAIKAWRKITKSKKSSYSGHYNIAQLFIGNILKNDENTEDAIKTLRNIERSDGKKYFYEAKLLIGEILVEKGDTEGAMIEWSDIEYDFDHKRYARARLNIGEVLATKNCNEEALQSWCEIRIDDDLKSYVKAQINIDTIINNIDKSTKKDFYQNFNVKSFIDNKKIIKSALSKWDESDNPKEYAKAHFDSGEKIIYSHSDEDIADAILFFEKSKTFYSYESYCYINICKLLLDKNKYIFGRKLQIFLNKIILIINELTLYSDNSNNKKKMPERKLAHYTGIDTTNLLLNNRNKLPSPFRLNTINNVNDPSEGHLLNNYLNGIKNTLFYALDFDENFQAFISCFTFNHDSLNQFRLYGKKDNKEASGVSLVLKQSFFQSRDIVSVVSNIPSLDDDQDFDKILEKMSITNRQNKTSKIIARKVDKKPIMRCIYVEPESDYIHLAQRNYLTFYREFRGEENPEKEWNRYKEDIYNKTLEVKKLLKRLKVIYQSLKNKHSEDFEECSSLINKTLLPLKYLIKHSAFQEEQECRMIYITSLDKPEVQMDFGKFLYVEYEADVKAHLDKVYIAPAATQYQPYLAKLLCDTNVKIELSNNPYRQTS